MTEMEMMAAMGLPTALGGGGGAAAHPAPQKADPTRCKAAAWADESERPCKQCKRSLSAIMYTPKQWTKAAPCCIDCAFELRMAGLDDGADGGAERVVATTAHRAAKAAKLAAPAARPAVYEEAPEEEDPCVVATRQLEYYFSPKNWAKDEFLRNLADDEGFVAVEALCSFPRLAAALPSARGIGQEADGVFLRRCVRYGSSLELSDDGSRLRRDPNAPEARKKRKRADVFVSDRGAIALEATPEELAARASRAARFEAPDDDEEYAVDDEPAPLPEDWDAGDGGDDDEGASKWRVAGTCRTLAKAYYRLTSAPRPRDVRPPDVLEAALAWVAESLDADYERWTEQFKSLRQDVTVQGLRGDLAVRVYAAHARYALDHGDLNEFNQCQTKLAGLHGLDDAGSDEFAAYALLYALVFAGPRPHAAALGVARCLERRGPAAAHALRVASALNLDDAPSVLALARSAPHRGGRILDALAPKLRGAAYVAVLRAFAPSLPVSRAHVLLGFEDEPTAADAYLADRGAVCAKNAVLIKESRDAFNKRKLAGNRDP